MARTGPRARPGSLYRPVGTAGKPQLRWIHARLIARRPRARARARARRRTRPGVPSAGTARDRILDAFEELLVQQGERGTTLESVAAAAGVSKGGLLYHFGGKEALVDGLLARMSALAQADVARLRAAERGPVDLWIRSSLSTATPFDRAYVATSRLAQGNHPRARDTLTHLQDEWAAVIPRPWATRPSRAPCSSSATACTTTARSSRGSADPRPPTPRSTSSSAWSTTSCGSARRAAEAADRPRTRREGGRRSSRPRGGRSDGDQSAMSISRSDVAWMACRTFRARRPARASRR